MWGLTFLWLTIFISFSSLNALLAYVSLVNGLTSFLIATFSPLSASNAELKRKTHCISHTQNGVRQ